MSVGLALLGTGRIAETAYVPATAEVEGARLTAVLSRDQARAEEFASRHGIDNAYSDLDALLADPKVEGVIVATPDALHEPQVIAAARAGKHVLCEKPMGVSVEGCRRMAAAVKAGGITFAMGYDNRFNAGLARIKQMIDEGAIGAVRYVHSHVTTAVSNPHNWRGAGELTPYWAMSATGTHQIDIYRWFFGDPAQVGGGLAAPVHQGPNDEICILVLNYPGRLIAELTSIAVLPANNRLEIYGEGGSIIGEHVFGRSHPQAVITCKGDRILVDQANPFIAEIADFVEAIGEGREPFVTLEDGIRNMHIMETALKGPMLLDL